MSCVVFEEDGWIHLDRNEPGLVQQFKALGITSSDAIRVLTENTGTSRPKVLQCPEGKLVTFKVPLADISSVKVATLRVLAKNDGNVVSVRGTVIPFISYRPQQYGNPISFIMSGISYEFESFAVNFEEKVDIADMVRSGTNQRRTQLLGVKRSLHKVLRDARPMVRVMETLKNYNMDAFEMMSRALLDLEAVSSRVTGLLGDIASEEDRIASSNLYKLSIMSAIFLPASFITGLLGVNLDGMPFTKSSPHAFYMLCAVEVVMCLTVVWYMFRKGMVKK